MHCYYLERIKKDCLGVQGEAHKTAATAAWEPSAIALALPSPTDEDPHSTKTPRWSQCTVGSEEY